MTLEFTENQSSCFPSNAANTMVEPSGPLRGNILIVDDREANVILLERMLRGAGYPNGLRGADIPLAARIMNICDVYDALRSKRPYKPAMHHLKAVDIIMCGRGRTRPEHFDPALLAAFKQSHPSFQEIFEAHG